MHSRWRKIKEPTVERIEYEVLAEYGEETEDLSSRKLSEASAYSAIYAIFLNSSVIQRNCYALSPIHLKFCGRQRSLSLGGVGPCPHSTPSRGKVCVSCEMYECGWNQVEPAGPGDSGAVSGRNCTGGDERRHHSH